MIVLVLNVGSSTLKATLYRIAGEVPETPPEPLWRANADWGRHPGKAAITVRSGGAARREWECAIEAPWEVVEPVLRTIWEGETRVLAGPQEIEAVGHRVVHGGQKLRESTRITAEVKAEIERVGEFAPEHNPLQASAITAAERVLGPAVPQIAVFDTAFHRTLEAGAYTYGGPYGWIEQGIRRYGFHGISYQYTSRRAASILGRASAGLRLVVCHLGNGCSLAAVRDGASVDTTMGFTPLEGLVMGSRSGSVDPAILIYLMRRHGYTAEQLDRMLNKESGLRGLSGVSADMREVMAARAAGNERARLALDVFTHRLCRDIGGMLVSLGGLDALVFTGGIGENSAELRAAVCERLGFLGLRLDPARNAASPADADVAKSDSAVRVLVVRTAEDWEIACECRRMARPAK